MNLIRRNQNGSPTLWDPFHMLETLQDDMNRLFDFSFSKWPEKSTGLLQGGWSPAIDIYDEKDELIVKADLPGLTKDDIEVTIEGNILTLKGEKKHEEKTKEKDYVREERFYGAFHRAIALPTSVDADKVKAAYKNGVLELTLPKKEEAKPKQINVEVK